MSTPSGEWLIDQWEAAAERIRYVRVNYAWVSIETPTPELLWKHPVLGMTYGQITDALCCWKDPNHPLAGHLVSLYSLEVRDRDERIAEWLYKAADERGCGEFIESRTVWGTPADGWNYTFNGSGPNSDPHGSHRATIQTPEMFYGRLPGSRFDTGSLHWDWPPAKFRNRQLHVSTTDGDAVSVSTAESPSRSSEDHTGDCTEQPGTERRARVVFDPDLHLPRAIMFDTGCSGSTGLYLITLEHRVLDGLAYPVRGLIYSVFKGRCGVAAYYTADLRSLRLGVHAPTAEEPPVSTVSCP